MLVYFTGLFMYLLCFKSFCAIFVIRCGDRLFFDPGSNNASEYCTRQAEEAVDCCVDTDFCNERLKPVLLFSAG